ncbi:hypothetical protein AB0K09_05035 [Streptomyces sp. NPDC049577]|uniref:hypothetical protein n=1 Tax=Streptomyces sp. NPDC049577 TaxID=3155153 RepID=UPI00343A056A
MSGNGDLRASEESLGLITKGLTDAIGELKEFGGIGESSAGRGFGALALSGTDTGHDGLTSAFKEFCERWEWGVRSLVHDGNEFARRVGLSAGLYYEQDKYVEGTLKVVAAGLVSDPTLADEQAEKMSMGEIADHSYFADADYSGQSFKDAATDMAKTDRAVYQDTRESQGHDGALRAALEAARRERAQDSGAPGAGDR